MNAHTPASAFAQTVRGEDLIEDLHMDIGQVRRLAAAAELIIEHELHGEAPAVVLNALLTAIEQAAERAETRARTLWGV